MKGDEMQQKAINPWGWQNQLGFSQAIEVSGAQRVLYCAGQASMSADGKPLHEGDMRAQIGQALDNLDAVLTNGGWSLSNVVRLNYYTTNVDGFFAAYDVVLERLKAAGIQPSATLLGVTRLAFPELLIEIEATAVK
jgi:enamine deaminase RidA (YjgF/YER057c/UK114 family)